MTNILSFLNSFGNLRLSVLTVCSALGDCLSMMNYELLQRRQLLEGESIKVETESTRSEVVGGVDVFLLLYHAWLRSFM